MSQEEQKTESDRREHPRYAVNFNVEITTESGKTTGMMVGTSLEGLRIQTTTGIQPATDVVVTLLTDKKVILLAGVAWVLDQCSQGLPCYLAGLKINSVSVDGKELVGAAERTAFLQELL